jgi:hypothetical protein
MYTIAHACLNLLVEIPVNITLALERTPAIVRIELEVHGYISNQMIERNTSHVY